MATRTFTLDRRGVKKLMGSSDMGRGMRDAAAAIADQVRHEAPERTGYYARRVRHGSGDEVDGAATAVVYTLDEFWHLVEYGSLTNHPYAPMRRGVEAAGARFHDPGPGAL